jgi:DMSO/TMAO reductase YedYZ molybdopterin-dependent catalytic subunit
MTRRKFVRLAGSTIALAGVPLAARAMPEQRPPSFGGPTPNADFYLTSYSSTPRVDASQWSLRIKGLVANPLELSYADLRKLPPIERTLTLECISNPPDGSAISNARWVGVKLKPILDRASVSDKAVYAAMRAADGFYTGVPIDEIMRDENFLPYLMNGEPLPPAHGFPLRIFIPGKYGMKQPKCLTEIEFVDHEFIGYWEARGWSNSAWRKINSGFFSPRPSSGLLSMLSGAVSVKTPIDLVGWSLAGPPGVRKVEVSTDAGTSWRDAELIDDVNPDRSRWPYVWTVWRYRFAPKAPGRFAIRVRATAGDGTVQPPTDPQTGSGMSGQARMELEVTSVG